LIVARRRAGTVDDPDVGQGDDRCVVTVVHTRLAGAPDVATVVRVVDEAGRLAAMAHLREGRLYPDKVFISGEA